ncbi:MAG: response regulator transcription factor [Planctomycetia bacterium]|nr:response regulator transcription factor [Planctomycetia bacterium]
MAKLLIAEDNEAARSALRQLATSWGYEVVAVDDGAPAWDILQRPDAPALLLLDWNMPRLDGLELCRLVRAVPRLAGSYIILLTGRTADTDLLAGLEAGADEYLAKPVNHLELRARLQAGRRIVELQQRLAGKIAELEEALKQVQTLDGLLPVCAYCKRVRDDRNYWQQLEAYIAAHSRAQVSHGICPECFETRVRPELAALGVEPGPNFPQPPGP